ncbi:hypothetical protein PO909_014392 [Leuciscus waleckii]
MYLLKRYSPSDSFRTFFSESVYSSPKLHKLVIIKHIVTIYQSPTFLCARATSRDKIIWKNFFFVILQYLLYITW